MIGTAAAFSSGVTWATLPVFFVGFCPFLVFLSSFANKDAYWQLTRFDYTCGALSILALMLWYMTNDANIAIIFAIASDFAAGLPTLIKSWKFPETETAIAYAVTLFSALTSFLVIKQWMFASYAFPLYLVLMNAAITFAIIRRRLGIR